MTGCVKTVVKTVKVDSFCEDKFESLWLENQDFDNIGQIRANKSYKITLDKFVDNATINEKEYQLCLEKENAN